MDFRFGNFGHVFGHSFGHTFFDQFLNVGEKKKDTVLVWGVSRHGVLLRTESQFQCAVQLLMRARLSQNLSVQKKIQNLISHRSESEVCEIVLLNLFSDFLVRIMAHPSIIAPKYRRAMKSSRRGARARKSRAPPFGGGEEENVAL